MKNILWFNIIKWIFSLAAIVCFLNYFSLRSEAIFQDDERFIFPFGMTTAEVLPEKGFDFAVFPTGYFFYGVSDKLTIGWDWWGVFLKIPAFDFKLKVLTQQENMPGMAVDFYFFILPELMDDTLKVENNYDDLYLAEKGHKHVLRLNLVKSSGRMRIHFSGGYAYGDYLELYRRAENRDLIQGEVHRYYIQPSFCLGMILTFSRRWESVIYWSYGDTILNYLDQIPFKIQTGIGIVYAPFNLEKFWLDKAYFEFGIIYYNLYDLELEMILPVIALKLRF